MTLEIEANFLVESKKRSTGKIPINIKAVNPYTVKVLTESIEVSRNKPGLLKLGGEFLEGKRGINDCSITGESRRFHWYKFRQLKGFLWK